MLEAGVLEPRYTLPPPPPPPSSFPVKCQWLLRITTLVLNMIRLHIYHITEEYCPDGPLPVATLIS